MNPFGISDASYSLIMSTFRQSPHVDEVLVFGSRAKGTHRNGSDIDLAIKGGGCDAGLAMELKGKFNEELPLPYYVDIVDYRSLQHTELKEHIDRVGKMLYKKSTQEKDI